MCFPGRYKHIRVQLTMEGFGGPEKLSIIGSQLRMQFLKIRSSIKLPQLDSSALLSILCPIQFVFGNLTG